VPQPALAQTAAQERLALLMLEPLLQELQEPTVQPETAAPLVPLA
jgi:hypothetical protein